MSETLARKRLADAEAAVIDETKEIEKQRAFIEKLRNDGHKTEQAERVLEMVQRSRAAIEHRDSWLEQLRLFEAGKAGSF